MSDLYRAELKPTKLEVLADVLELDPDEIEQLASYRFDDPEGQVGMEVHIVSVHGDVLQIPLTYRPEPLEDAEPDDLVCEMEHGVLGTRYIYFATADAVFAEALASAIAEKQSGAEQFIVDGDERIPFTKNLAEVRGTGPIDFDDYELGEDVFEIIELVSELDIEGLTDEEAAQPGQLVGTWAGQDKPVLLASTGLAYEDDLDDELDAEELDEAPEA